MTFNAPEASTIASCAARASNLFGAVMNSYPVIFEISAATFSSKPLFVFKPCQVQLADLIDFT